MSAHIRFSATTHVGKVRKVNEDSILALPEANIWVVSDGMGGHAAGDYASQAVTDAVAMLPVDLSPGDRLRELRSSIAQANSTIFAESMDKGATMGATVVALLLTDGHFAAVWAGDSRAYRFRSGQVEMLTHDHSLVAQFVDAGQMTWDEAEKHPQSNVITRAVGIADDLELDKVRGTVSPGDRFLLCSDGLSKYATFDILTHALNDQIFV